MPRGEVRGREKRRGAALRNAAMRKPKAPEANRAGIVAHRRMAIALRDQVAKMIAEGKTQEQIVAAKITNRYEKQTGNAPGGTGDRFIGQLYAELKASS